MPTPNNNVDLELRRLTMVNLMNTERTEREEARARRAAKKKEKKLRKKEKKLQKQEEENEKLTMEGIKEQSRTTATQNTETPPLTPNALPPPPPANNLTDKDGATNIGDVRTHPPSPTHPLPRHPFRLKSNQTQPVQNTTALSSHSTSPAQRQDQNPALHAESENKDVAAQPTGYIPWTGAGIALAATVAGLLPFGRERREEGGTGDEEWEEVGRPEEMAEGDEDEVVDEVVDEDSDGGWVDVPSLPSDDAA